MQVFHTDDGEVDAIKHRAEDGTPISEQEAAGQEILGKSAKLLQQVNAHGTLACKLWRTP